MTPPQSSTEKETNNRPALISSNSQDVIDLLISSFKLHLGKMSDEAWLKDFARAVQCDSTACVRWTSGNPDQAINSAHGELTELPTGWRNLIDHAINASSLRQPAFIEDYIKATLEPHLFASRSIDNPRFLMGVVDWEPACIVMLMVRNNDQAEWSQFERKQVKQILGYVRESIIVHKELDRRRYISGLASEVLNSSPRGIIALSEDGIIQMANSRAETMLDDRDGLCRNNSKLQISDKKTSKALADHLGNLKNMTGDGLPEMDWNLIAERPSGKPGYQIILGSIKLRDWNIESRANDRMAIVYLHDLADTTRPTATQMRDFYSLTAAQAKVASAIYNGQSIGEAAKKLNISINTARTHMRDIYAKTGVNTQTELISLLTSGLKTYGKRKD
jgi:DNA-binding CsgD family transcriptional regulator/PAS domain-containing protein